jgi:hypothetical protein
MSNVIRLSDRPELLAEIEAGSGDLVRLHDRKLNLDIIDQPPEWEFQVNRQAHPLKLEFHQDGRGLLETIARTQHFGGHSQGWALQVGRIMVPGESSLHIQYRIKRVRLTERIPVPGPSPYELEMPLWIDTLGFLGWRFSLIKPDTTMRVAHLGCAGPREHLSFEEGPVSEVTPLLENFMRRTYPGQQAVPGALYYRQDTDAWLCIYSRRAKLAHVSDFTGAGTRFHVQYHKLMEPDGEFPVPEFSLAWGRGRESMEQFWSGMFDQYEEPPGWLYRTTWAMMDYHSVYSGKKVFRPGPFKFKELGETAEACIKAGGANGFWFYTHTIKRSDSDTAPYSAGPNPDQGTHTEFRDMVRRIHDAGGRAVVWLSTAGLRPHGDIRPEWMYRGVDGRPWISWGFNAHEFIAACNPLHPGFRQYMLDWTRRYLEEFDVDGFFLDCGVFTYPCDFSPWFVKDHFPSEAGPAMQELYRDMWDLAQRIKPGQVHMFHEGVHADYPGSGYMMCGHVRPPRPAGTLTAWRQMVRFGQYGKRLNWSSFTPFDLASGFVHWNPVCGATDKATMLNYAADPMNQLVVKLVKERGVREARGITDGLSRLGDTLVTIPGFRGPLPLALGGLDGVSRIRNILTGSVLEIRQDAGLGPVFDLEGGAAYERS